MNCKLSECLGVVATIDPQTVANVAKYSDYVKLDTAHRYIAIALLGDMAAETIDFAIVQAQDDQGTGEKPLKAATQLAVHAANNDNAQLVINVRPEELDLANGFTHIRASLVTGDAVGGPAAVLILAGDVRDWPALGLNLATVKQIVS